ncbi:MAG: hypothetical protein OEQ53_00160 [Saprospiraceae bacterium]|nr:hypothetical protein [Saprospiraceae bacterium]
MDLSNIKSKVKRYQSMIKNTADYRQSWIDSLRKMIMDQLAEIVEDTGMSASVDAKSEWNNLEAIALNLGQQNSGISEEVGDAQRHLIKSNGMLIYQQLFNGKVMVSIMYPFIEGLAKPKPPKQIEILRPEELKLPFILRHVEEFLKEIIAWEDYDDDVPQQIGFSMGFDAANAANLEEVTKS